MFDRFLETFCLSERGWKLRAVYYNGKSEMLGVSVLLIMLGGLLLLSGLTSIIRYQYTKMARIYTTGEVVRFGSYEEEQRTGQVPYVMFYTNTDELVRVYDPKVRNKQDGQKVRIFYHPDNPSDIMINPTCAGAVALITLGFIPLGAGIGTFIGWNSHRKRVQNLIDTGILVEMPIIKVQKEHVYVGITINHYHYRYRYGYQVFCQGRDGFGVARLFLSEWIWADPDRSSIETCVGWKIPVYLDPQDPKNYYMDCDALL